MKNESDAGSAMLRSLLTELLLSALLATSIVGCRHAPSGAENSQMAAWVREALAEDPRVPTDRSVVVAASDGIVTLSGSVPTLAARHYAVLETQKLLGVRGVIDRLEVTPGGLGDPEITAEIERRLRAAVVDPEATFAVSTSAGRVWLEGDIATWAEVEEAELIAAEVPGVRDVTNQLAARDDVRADDDVVRGRIESALRRDAVLAQLPIRVTVAYGEVVLEGAVASAHERHRALRRTRHFAPGGAVTDHLRVSPHLAPRPLDAESPEGAELAEVVRLDLSLDPRLRGAALEVSADGRLVVLEGRVRHLGQKRIAEADARNVLGVAWVTNDLVAPGHDRTDTQMQAEVSAAFASSPGLQTLSAEVSDGVVTLRGIARDWAVRARAGVVAAGVEGVREVRNEIDVETDGTVSEPEIARRVRARLERSAATALVAERIQVDADGGVVRLAGDVDTWGQWQAAQRVARRTPGARSVVNDLSVDPYPFTLEDTVSPDEGWLDHDPPYAPKR